jgi:hypothetical protein
VPAGHGALNHHLGRFDEYGFRFFTDGAAKENDGGKNENHQAINHQDGRVLTLSAHEGRENEVYEVTLPFNRSHG